MLTEPGEPIMANRPDGGRCASPPLGIQSTLRRGIFFHSILEAMFDPRENLFDIILSWVVTD